MFKKLFLVFVSVCSLIATKAQQNSITGTTEWVVKNPFERNVFIQNNGQFTKYEKQALGNKILYYTDMGRLHFYFLPNAFAIRMDSLYFVKDKDDDDKDSKSGKKKDDLDGFTGKPYYLKMEWVGADLNARVEVQDLVPDFFSYPNPNDPKGQSGVTAHAWKKLIYHNMYPGIDIELFYPDKGGIEYNIVVHPGADPSVVKMQYSGDADISEINKEVHINWVNKLIDHAPTAQDESGKDVGVDFQLHNKTVSFAVGNYDKSKTIVIDPWISATSLGGTNQAYDIGYDFLGNVYVYGGGANVSYKLQKYSSAGALIWTYTTTYTYIYGTSYFYGDLTVDHRSGTSYICEGFDPSPACSVIKVSTLGVQQAKGPGTTTDEEWRVGFDYCNNQLVLDGGGEGGITAEHQDTNCTTMTGVNMLGSGNVWDQSLLGFDNAGKVYIGTSNMYGNVALPYGNYLCKMPLPTMTPTTYQVPDHHDFIEIQNITYYPIIAPYAAGNGFNGLVATPTKVFTYDGGKMRCWKASNGTIIDSATVSGTAYAWGGIDLDCADNVYCGNNKSISIYDSNLNALGNVGLSNTVYDVAVSPHGYVYACGNGYVQCVKSNHKMVTVTVVQPGCGCTGSITANPCGQAPFTYLWSNGATTSSITGLCSGGYTVTVKTGGCLPLSDTAQATLVAAGGSLTATITPTPVKCNGGATGSITTTVAGGTAPYTYAWNPGGQTTSSVTGLTAGSYTCVVKDHSGCIDTLKTVITQPAVLTATTTVVPVKCNGGNTGSSTVTAGGGTPAYLYAWAPGGQTSATATNLTAGTYTVTVTDANGCTVTATSVITQPPALTASATVVNILCNGGTGSSTVTAGGGTPAYVYTWAPGGQTNVTATGLTAGTYTVTVKDANGCTITATSIITQPPALTATTTVIPVKCNGGATGSSTVTAGGGTPAYLYSWAPGGQTSATATNLTAGTYTVTVTDANGCTITATSIITQPPVLTATTTVIPVKCNGGATGSSTVTAGGGTPAYLYSWAPGGQTNITATGLTAGTYTVTVTDANGCTKTATSVITQPPALTETTSSTTATCGQSNGSVSVVAGGGTPAYVYAWAPGGATTANVTGLSANTYTVTVTDANGCTITATATVANAAAETVTITGSVNILCNGGATGSITTNTVGGTPPYNYAWTPSGGTGANATGLTAGCYTVTVKDANGCVSTASACITQPTALTAVMSNTPVKCNGGNTGTTTVVAGGGTPAYVYTWAPGGQTSTTATNLTAGTYTVTIKDANGCTLTASTTITQPTALTATTTVIPVKCNGGNTGSSTVTAGGGTPAYVYAWAPGGQTNATATNLTAGIYTVTVTDANGCTITATATITQPTALTETTSNTTATCGQSNGSVTVVAGGGTPGYNYSWTPGGATTANVTGLSANTYTVTVTDANGCTITATSTIANAAAEVVTITGSVNILCNGGNNGSITTNTVGGTPPYNYAWTPSGQTGANATGLTAGCYTVTVHDANGCTSTASACLTQPTALTATTSNTPVLCNGGNTGSTDVTAGGGTPGYVYTWAPGGQTNANATNLTAGTYTVTVKDANGCTITATATVTQPTALTLTTGGVVNVLCNGGNNGSATATAGGGTPAYNYAWSNGQTGTNTTGLTVGTYTVTATDANGCTITATATITQPTALTATTTTITSTCGKPNGSATDVAGGGTPGYSYSWAPGGQTNATATGLTTGIYTVTETDANGCTLTATATVANAAAETITITGSVNILCNGGNNGSINTNTVGGTPPYNYAWTPSGQTGANATGLTAGCYTVTVTDANGCLSTASACITEPTALTLTTGGIVNVLCNGGNNGSATTTAGGGTPAYNYAWSNGQTGTNATGLTVGTYTVTVTDADGCTLTATATITQPTVLTISTGGIVNVLCNAGNNGSATTAAAGGTPAYNYSWSNGQTGTNATGLTVGIYTVTVTDADGCTATATATITQPTALTATTTTITSTCGKPNGSATDAAGGGTPGYSYAWSNGQTNATATGLTAGIYTVTETDANGCTLTATANVANAAAEVVSISGSVNVLCNGGNNGSINTNTVGGTPPYNYIWTPSGQTNANATGLTAGCYTVSVTDANGCLSTASACITQPTALTLTTGGVVNVSCNGSNNGSATTTAGGGTPVYNYTWSNGQTGTNATGLTVGTYTVTVTDANGCTLTATATISQPTALSLTAAGFPVTCNGGNDGQATVIPAGGTPAYNYVWSNGATVANINNLTAGSYTVTITDAHGCTHDTVVTVSQPAPIVVAFSADTINGCAPLCTGFKDASTDPGGTITHWSWLYSDGGKDTVQNPRHCFTSPGSYSVTLTVVDNHGCTSTLTIPNMITVYTAPVAAFDFGPQPTTIVNPTISFTDKSTDAYGLASWLWNFNDPLNDVPSTLQNPSHAYGDTGTFCATLTVTNIHGCVDSITQCVVISSQYTLYIPDAFSPNADGKNDIFQPKGQFVKDYKMYIFDRWGMLIFYTDDFNKGWNGSVNNGSKVCQEDTYVYLIEATDTQGVNHKYIGKVTLLQ